MDELHAIFWYSPSIAQCLAYEMPRLQVFVHGGQFLLGKARVPPWLRCAAPNLSTSVLAALPCPAAPGRAPPCRACLALPRRVAQWSELTADAAASSACAASAIRAMRSGTLPSRWLCILA